MNLVIKNLTISYRLKRFEKKIFEDVNLELQPGINFIIGESGSGKTTLLKAIAGVFPLRDGAIYYGDEKLSLSLSLRKEIYYPRKLFFDDYQVIDNLVLAILEKGDSFTKTKEKILSIIPESLSGHLNTKYRNLSSGQRQLVDLTLINHFHPKIILLDEPTANLSLEEYQGFLSFLEALPLTSLILVATNDERIMSIKGYEYYKVIDKKVLHA